MYSSNLLLSFSTHLLLCFSLYISIPHSRSYYPCKMILKPGQHIHIGKGREHMFRKLTFEKLPEHDCHAKLRADLCKELIEVKKLKQAPLCVSVAFDW